MPRLTERICADAATWLELSPGTHPEDMLDRYRGFLCRTARLLRLHHRRGAGGREVCAAGALVHDLALASLMRTTERLPSSGTGPLPVVLIAFGSYGREEVSPAGHVDVLFLQDLEGPGQERRTAPAQLRDSALVSRLLPRVKCAVHTLDTCIREAEQDPRMLTALLDARRIDGDPALFARFEETVTARCIRDRERAYFAAWREERKARLARYGATVGVQEPNVEYGCGGLRDRQGVRWLALLRGRGRARPDAGGVSTPDEERDLDAAYDFLLRVRNELHYHCQRATDWLSKDAQPFIAHGLGYRERSRSRRLDRFMGDYYRHARTVCFIAGTIEKRLALAFETPEASTPRRCRARNEAVDGFIVSKSQIAAASPRILREDPARLMGVFVEAQRRGIELDPDLAQRVRQEARRVSPAFRNDPRVRRAFLDILGAAGRVAPTLRAMHEAGLLGAYLPEFGQLTNLIQHEFYHQYTVDEHTLVCLEKLDAIANTATGPLAPYHEILHHRVERPFLLYLAVLLHDAGKARRGEDHSEAGGRIAITVARRLGLDPGTARTLRVLVRNHLSMILVSQRRDLDEPAEVRRFADEIGSLEVLRLLTLMTVADSLGTSDRLWNGFKDTLLLTLYHRAEGWLSGRGESPVDDVRQRHALATEVRRQRPPGIAEEEITAHFDKMPPRYFLQRAPADIIADLELAHAFLERALSDTRNALEPVLRAQHDPERAFSRFQIATWDRPGLFGKVCAALTAAGLNILSAEILTRLDRIALDTFHVTNATPGATVGPADEQRFAALLRDTLCDGRDLAGLLPGRTSPGSAPTVSRHPVRTTIRFDNQLAETRTVLEITAADRVGLLYRIAQALAELDLDVSVAKISTHRGLAQDTFYVSEPGGSKISSRPRRIEIQRRLRAVIAS